MKASSFQEGWILIGSDIDCTVKFKLSAEKALLLEENRSAKLEQKKFSLLKKACIQENVTKAPKRDIQGLLYFKKSALLLLRN